MKNARNQPRAAPIDIDLLLWRLKQEASVLFPDNAASDARSESPSPPLVNARGEEVSVSAPAVSTETLRDLLGMDDDAFVHAAYRSVLRREPDTVGWAVYRGELAKGTSRCFILASMLWSEEAARKGGSVEGMGWARPLRVLPAKGATRPLFALYEKLIRAVDPGIETERIVAARIGALVRSLKETQSREEQREASMLALSDRLSEHDRRAQDAARHVDFVAERVSTLGHEIAELTAHQGDSDTAQERLRQSLVKLARDVDLWRSDLVYQRGAMSRLAAAEKQRSRRDGDMVPEDPIASGIDAAGTEHETGADLQEQKLAVFYATFEDAFRGDRQQIQTDLAVYLSDLDTAGCVNAAHPLLDLGCGRGEWLELLKERGFAAAGADTNPITVDYCRERDLDVRLQDALAFLAEQADASCGAVTAFHLIEHLPFPTLYALLEEAHRALRPGGLLVLETPNPENILVGSHTFYHDPTHRNPMTPSATAFLVQYLGFSAPEVRRLHPYPAEARVSGNDPLTERVNGHLCGPQDFSVIATKPALVG